MKQYDLDKKHFREQSLKLLRNIPPYRHYRLDKMAQKKLLQCFREINAKIVMLYLPLSSEVNIYPVIRILRRERKKVYVPFMEGESFRLVQYRLPLETKKFGIKEPKYSNQYRKKKIDIAVVPIVGVDITGRRVGFGKGMYDRFFEKEGKTINKTVFVARQLCFSKRQITDDYDVRAELIITP